MNGVVHPFAGVLLAGNVPRLVEHPQRLLEAPFAPACFTGERCQSRPAAAFVIGAIGQGEKHQLVAGGELDLPHEGHHADAHAGHPSRIPRFSSSASNSLVRNRSRLRDGSSATIVRALQGK